MAPRTTERQLGWTKSDLEANYDVLFNAYDRLEHQSADENGMTEGFLHTSGGSEQKKQIANIQRDVTDCEGRCKAKDEEIDRLTNLIDQQDQNMMSLQADITRLENLNQDIMDNAGITSEGRLQIQTLLHSQAYLEELLDSSFDYNDDVQSGEGASGPGHAGYGELVRSKVLTEMDNERLQKRIEELEDQTAKNESRDDCKPANELSGEERSDDEAGDFDRFITTTISTLDDLQSLEAGRKWL